MYVTLDIAKKHLNVEADFADDDEYITHLIEVAEDVVGRELCKPLEELEDENHAIPATVMQCILLMLGNLYENREPVAFANAVEVPLAYRHLLGLYKEPQL